MRMNIMMSLDLRPTQKRQIRGMIATLTLASDLGRCTGTTKIREVRDALAQALLTNATFETIILAKYLLNDCTGYINRVLGGDISDCLGLVADTLQSVFDHYSNLADCKGL